MIGSGGMGDVFKARHAGLGAIHAVKLINRRFEWNQEVFDRFRQEWRALGSLKRPRQIVQAYHADEIDGFLFLGMEYVQGMDLRTLVKARRRLSVSEAIGLITQTAHGLDEMHRCGLVHRDIKPSNLMCDELGTVRILDLGLAKLAPSLQSGDPLTVGPMGTPEFMAPEQSEDSHEVDIRADLYSLGCTFYYLLTGSAPFGSRREISNWELIRAHREDPVPDIRLLMPRISEATVSVLERLLSKRPQDRFTTPHDLLCHLDGEERFSVRAGTADSVEMRDYSTVGQERREPRSQQRTASPRTKFNRELTLIDGVEVAQRERAEWSSLMEVPESWMHESGTCFLFIPPGRFWMGAGIGDAKATTAEKPRHIVCVERPFWIATFPITNDLLLQARQEGDEMSVRFQDRSFATQLRGMNVAGDAPAVNVNLDDVECLCRFLSVREGNMRQFRLPTEAEWEYAARAGATGPFWWEDSGIARQCAIFNGSGGAAPPSKERANAWGLIDTLGNVAEWTSTQYGELGHVSSTSDATQLPGALVVRGGSWRDELHQIRLSARVPFHANRRADFLGARLVCEFARDSELSTRT